MFTVSLRTQFAHTGTGGVLGEKPRRGAPKLSVYTLFIHYYDLTSRRDVDKKLADNTDSRIHNVSTVNSSVSTKKRQPWEDTVVSKAATITHLRTSMSVSIMCQHSYDMET